MSNRLPTFQLTYRHFYSIRHVFTGTLSGVLTYELVNLIRPHYGEMRPLMEGHLLAFLKDAIIYYYLFELVSVFIFFRIALLYFKIFSLNQLGTSIKSLGIYLLKCLPIFPISIFIFVPITNGLRFLFYAYPHYTWKNYFPKYFFREELFLLYLVPLLIFGLGFIIYNAFEDFSDMQNAKVDELQQHIEKLRPESETTAGLQTITGFDEKGEYPISTKDIWWFEVEKRNYYAFTDGKTYQINKTLGELETELNPKMFFRINRSVIINILQLQNFNYWENDKYKIFLKDDKTEFVIQRVRLNELKKILNY